MTDNTRIADLSSLRVLNKNRDVVDYYEMRARRDLPIFIEFPGQMIEDILHVDRFYLTVNQGELVYLHESLPYA